MTTTTPDLLETRRLRAEVDLRLREIDAKIRGARQSAKNAGAIATRERHLERIAELQADRKKVEREFLARVSPPR